MRRLFAIAALACAAPVFAEDAAPALSFIGTALNIDDVDKELGFYRDMLGLKLAMTLKGSHATEYMLSFDGDPRKPGLILQKAAEKKAKKPKHGTAFNRIVLRVTDMDALAALLDKAGYAHEPIRDVAMGYRMMMITDPEGYRLEIVQSKAAQ